MAPRTWLHEARELRGQLCLSSMVGITGSVPDSRTTWIHVAPMGEWQGHSSGTFSLTTDHFQSVRDVIANQRTPVSVDYEHASVYPTGEPTPAAGFVQATEVRDDGLWCLVEFTTRAADHIKAGEYRFCSGVFSFVKNDPVSGQPLLCVLDSIALTNRPFIDGQNPITLTRTARNVSLTTGAKSMEIDMKALQKLLDAIPGPNTADKISKALALMASGDAPADPAAAKEAAASRPLNSMVPLAAPVPTPAPAPAPAPAVATSDAPMAPVVPAADPVPPAADPDGDAAMDQAQTDLMQATGLDMPGLVQALRDNWDMIVSMLTGQSPEVAATAALSRDTAVKTLRDTVTEQAKQINVYRTGEAQRGVESLIACGKLHPSKRAEFVTLARDNPSAFKALTDVLPVHLPVAAHASALPTPPPLSENLASTAVVAKEPLPADHPHVVHLSTMLKAAGVTDPKIVASTLATLTR